MITFTTKMWKKRATIPSLSRESNLTAKEYKERKKERKNKLVFPLVPRLHLGTQWSPNFVAAIALLQPHEKVFTPASAMKLPQQVRSQVQLETRRSSFQQESMK